MKLNYDSFSRMSSAELDSSFGELIEQTTEIANADTSRFIRELPELDERHLVYGMLIFAKHQPDLILPEILRFIGHESQAVSAAAFNALNEQQSLPESVKTQLSNFEVPEDESRAQLLEMLQRKFLT